MNDPEKPKRGRPRKLDADKALDVAMNAYWRSDPADVSLNAICEMAGVSKPALYRAFTNEDGLMEAALVRYADQVLSEVFGILGRDAPFRETMAALTTWAAEDPIMEKGCVFYKMRAGKHRLGPKARARVQALDSGAVAAFAAYLERHHASGDWTHSLPARQVARYLVEQIGLALTQRAAGENLADIRAGLELALSAITPPE